MGGVGGRLLGEALQAHAAHLEPRARERGLLQPLRGEREGLERLRLVVDGEGVRGLGGREGAAGLLGAGGWVEEGEGPSGPGSWLSSELGLAGLLDRGDSDEQVLLAVWVAGEGRGDSLGEAPTTLGGGGPGGPRGEAWGWAAPKNGGWAPGSFSPL